MDKLKMQTPNRADENFKKLAAMFPNAVTETVDENGVVVRAIDKDVLMQEINTTVVDGKDERYQFTWPDKKKSVLLANAPIAKTLRPCPEESLGKDGTPGGFDSENLYIEGDNLEVLKLLQETYLGKIKMIYIDPPYNTGNDFVYEDDFAQSTEEYLANSGQYDEEGNRLVKNMDTNGRFHTDWLNMIYPRLKLAKDLLTEDGAIYISIADQELDNLKKVCNEIFGEKNFIGQIIWESTTQPDNIGGARYRFQQKAEYILFYAKNKGTLAPFVLEKLPSQKKYPHNGKYGKCRFEIIERSFEGAYARPTMRFQILGQYPREGKQWQIGEKQARELEAKGKVEVVDGIVKRAVYPEDEIDDDSFKPFWSIFSAQEAGTSQKGKALLKALLGNADFDTVKPVSLLKKLLGYFSKTGVYLDFFSGSATTAHAVMQLNAEDGGKRHFIMVQLPEETSEKSDAYKAGYKNICEIGKERIRRAGAKIKEENPLGTIDLDVGFRVLKCDTSNMKKVYYHPDEYNATMFDMLEDNIKEDRTPEDLLFQVMLDLGVLLSSKIEQTEIAGKKIFNVADNFLIACFDANVTEETITDIAKKKPYYFVMRDSSLANDSVAANFDQIFATYSPETTRKVL